MDVYFCRRLVMERLLQVQELIPTGMGTPEMGPITSGLGEIYQFKVSGEKQSLMELRSILDWDIAPKLRAVPGIVIPLSKVLSALEENNANAGGAYLEWSEQQSLIRGEGLVSSLEDIEKIVIGVSQTGTPITIRNVAQVRFAPMVRQGLATQDGKGEVVIGVVMMLLGENSRTVVDRVKVRLAEIQESLPKGVRIEPYYDRSDLVRRTIRTVTTNLVEGGFVNLVWPLLII
jgi:cobalt-zinc-cadmium resistance protein CzcA